MVYNRADLTVGPVAINFERSEFVDYTYPFQARFFVIYAFVIS